MWIPHDSALYRQGRVVVISRQSWRQDEALTAARCLKYGSLKTLTNLPTETEKGHVNTLHFNYFSLRCRHIINALAVPIACRHYRKSIMKGSDDGVMHFKESCYRTLSIVQCFSLKTTFRKLALLTSSGKKAGKGWNLLCGVPWSQSLDHWTDQMI
jgi:hypothetical protein